MNAPRDTQHEERWEMLAITLAEALRRILDLPKPGETAEEFNGEVISDHTQEVSS